MPGLQRVPGHGRLVGLSCVSADPEAERLHGKRKLHNRESRVRRNGRPIALSAWRRARSAAVVG